MSNRKPRPGRFAKRLALAIAFVLVATTTYSVEAQTYTLKVLHSFAGPPDGYRPMGALVRDAAGNLYGTTMAGGAFANCDPDITIGGTCGTVFKLSLDGTETILHNFSGVPDGGQPQTVLVRDGKGNLYGTTMYGGGASCPADSYGCGTVFKLDATGNETILHSFVADGNDGYWPAAGLRRDKLGNLYGTTMFGGNGPWCGPFSCGTVFEISPAGVETVVYSFANWNDGRGPNSRLVGDGKGNLYGTTGSGGTRGKGIVFKLAAGTHAETILFNFCRWNSLRLCPNGEAPYGLSIDAQGNLYGAAMTGGASDGVIFKLSAARKYTVLHRGDGPNGDLIQDSAGNFYGTTGSTVFKLTPSGTYTILHYFTGTNGDGAAAYAGLIEDSSGNFYGTTSQGGDLTCNPPYGCGTVFKLTP